MDWRTATARLFVLNTSSGKTVADVETGVDADDMSFDPAAARVYLACGDGGIACVEQVDADHHRKLPDTPTPQAARNSLLVPISSRFTSPSRATEMMPRNFGRTRAPTRLRSFFVPLAFAGRLGLGFWSSFVLGLLLATITIDLWRWLSPRRM